MTNMMTWEGCISCSSGYLVDSQSWGMSWLRSYIQDTGKQLFTKPERLKDPINLVQRPLDLKDKYDKIINLAFYNDKSFQNALNSTFEYRREFTQNSQPVRNKKIEKTHIKENNHTYKTIFTWFDNLPTSTEL